MESIDIRDFEEIVHEFVKYNDLEDSVAKSNTTFSKVVNIIAESLTEQGYQFTDDCKEFVKIIDKASSKLMTKLGHNRTLRSLVS